MKFLKQATYIRYVIAKLLKFFHISMQTFLDSFLQRIRWKSRRPWSYFLIKTFLLWYYINRPNFITRLPDCVYLPNYSLNCVLCFMLRHLMTSRDIWIAEILKFDYLKNEKKFQSEIKNIFSYFTCALH